MGGEEGAEPVWPSAKAMEDAWEPGAGVEEPSGVLGVERVDGRPGNWGEPSRPRRLRGGGKRCAPITGDPGKWWAAERRSERAVVVLIGGTT